MIPRILLTLLSCLLFACSENVSTAGSDLRPLQTPAAEAVLRHMLEICPHRKDAKQLTILLGSKMESASLDFEGRFADTGLIVTPASKIVAGAVNGEVRVFDGSTNQPPIQLQITSLEPEPANPANFEAIAAWAWNNKAQRLKLRVLTQADGKFEIRQIEEIPIPLRNQDGMPTRPPAPAPAVPAPVAP